MSMKVSSIMATSRARDRVFKLMEISITDNGSRACDKDKAPIFGRMVIGTRATGLKTNATAKVTTIL